MAGVSVGEGFSGSSLVVLLHPHREENTSPHRPCGQRGEGSYRESIGFHFKGFRFRAESAIIPPRGVRRPLLTLAGNSGALAVLSNHRNDRSDRHQQSQVQLLWRSLHASLAFNAMRLTSEAFPGRLFRRTIKIRGLTLFPSRRLQRLCSVRAVFPLSPRFHCRLTASWSLHPAFPNSSLVVFQRSPLH